jgi:hypothetical protein
MDGIYPRKSIMSEPKLLSLLGLTTLLSEGGMVPIPPVPDVRFRILMEDLHVSIQTFQLSISNFGTPEEFIIW